MKVEEAFQSVLQQVRSRLELKSKLHRKRILLQNLEHISLTLNKIEKLLGGEGSDVHNHARSSVEFQNQELVFFGKGYSRDCIEDHLICVTWYIYHSC